VSAIHTYAVGGILATVHGLALPVDRVSPWHAQRLSSVSWTDLAATAKAQGAGFADLLAETLPVLVDLDRIGQAAPAGPSVLCHNTLGPADVHLGVGGQLIVCDWEHAGGQPPSWELADALVHWTVDQGREVNAAGARAMVDGYRAVAGHLPPLDLDAFSGTATSMANYAYGEIDRALTATDDEERRHAERSVRHLLPRLPSHSTFERLPEVALTVTS
jgi:aminoglycoside phosphotransferase (APT) family kinase protein